MDVRQMCTISTRDELLNNSCSCHAEVDVLCKLKKRSPFTLKEESDLFNLCSLYMLCALNDIPKAMAYLEEAKSHLKQREEMLYQTYKECQRILRKLKYN